MDLHPVGMELHHEIEQFLYTEAHMLDHEMLREWLSTVVDPGIRYLMVVADERFRKDKSPAEDREVFLYDDDFGALDMRIRQFESGLQTMGNPAQRMFRMISNVRAYHNPTDGEFTVLSYGLTSRFRRLYENEQVAYSRKDILKKEENGSFRLLSRRIELGERVVRNKNLLFFL